MQNNIGGGRIDTYLTEFARDLMVQYTKIRKSFPLRLFFYQILAFAKRQPIHFFILMGSWAPTYL